VTYGESARGHSRGPTPEAGGGAEIAGYLGKSDVADEAFAASPWPYRDRD